MHNPVSTKSNALPDTSTIYCRDTTTKRPLYQILSPFPHSRAEIDSRINPHYGNHVVIAEGADFDIPHRNPWIFSAQSENPPSPVQEQPRAQIIVQLEDGTWEKRDQSPEPEYEDEEVLYLDSDIMERNLDTGFIGECGRDGCRKVLGCVDCKGKRPTALTPRSAFREACNLQSKNSSSMKDSAPDLQFNANQPFPTHLQRLSTTSVAAPFQVPGLPASYSKSTLPPSRTGPKIKYIRKRAADTQTEKPPIPNRTRAGHRRKKLV